MTETRGPGCHPTDVTENYGWAIDRRASTMLQGFEISFYDRLLYEPGRKPWPDVYSLGPTRAMGRHDDYAYME